MGNPRTRLADIEVTSTPVYLLDVTVLKSGNKLQCNVQYTVDRIPTLTRECLNSLSPPGLITLPVEI